MITVGEWKYNPVKDDARLPGKSGNPDEREHALEARDSGAVGPDEGEHGADRDAQGEVEQNGQKSTLRALALR